MKGGRVVLDGSQVLCDGASWQGEGHTEMLRKADPDAEVTMVTTRKLAVEKFTGCTDHGSTYPSWELRNASLIRDVPGCYERGLAVATGRELQQALQEDRRVGSIYLVDSIVMLSPEWPEMNVTWQVNVTGCGGVVWDTNNLPQRLFLWHNGVLTIDGKGNMTIANSRATPRRGHAWMLVGAFSVEFGIIHMKDLNITSSQPSALHPETVRLNPPRNWPLQCCDEGDIEHKGPEILLLREWALSKSAWVLGSAGSVIEDTGEWQFTNVYANVAEIEPCFSDYSVRVSNAAQLYNALMDHELNHIELMSSVDLHDWDEPCVISRPGVTVRACVPEAARSYVVTVPPESRVITVEHGASLSFEGDITLAFQAARSGPTPYPLDAEGTLAFLGMRLDCSGTCPIDGRLLEKGGTTQEDGTVVVQHLKIAASDILGAPDGAGGTWVLNNTELLAVLGSADSGQAGIVVAAVAGVAALAVVAWFVYRWRARRSAAKEPNLQSIEDGIIEGGGPLQGMVAMVQSRIQKVNDSKPKDRVQILELLGTGGNGKVYRGLWKGVTVAYKIVQLPPNKSKLEREQKKMAMETVISSSLRHPNVVQTFSYEIVPYEIGEGQEAGRANTDFSASITQTNMTDLTDYAENNKNLVLWEVSIVQEYCNRGSLRNALQQGAMPGQASEGGPPGMECCLLVAEDVACGMNHIHSMQICHGDLKAHNILLTSQERDEPPHIVAKVADFGLSVLLNTEQTHVSGVNQGTVTHMAPEILMSGQMTFKSDVYAYGILLFELFSGRRAYEGMSAIAITQKVVHSNFRPTFPATTPLKVVELACRCWDSNPEARPSFDDIIAEIRVLKDMNKRGLLKKVSSATVSTSASVSRDSSNVTPDLIEAVCVRNLQMQGSASEPGSRSARELSRSRLRSSISREPETDVVQEEKGEETDGGCSDDEDVDGNSVADETIVLTGKFLKDLASEKEP
eukprot:CAMPEP_0177598562 /NCGR_PEP_ID=MMETSP0419_2-20121207/12433_1 /TAXON_ID=582737 /ORGANISM="Tetraselmis sp., Strain GSL018" /LENGTH=965 /DNA_ID=CAMNT_0019091051 /DNA_START=562 /DNA_END=3459 /DNA_ORIENTATION=+